MDREAWGATVRGVAHSQTWPKQLGTAGCKIWINKIHNDQQEKEMTTHSSILAWRIPWTEEPGRLQFMGLQESDMT